MLGWILLSIGIAGFGLGAYWDLKTTEFPDWLPYCIIILALATRGLFAFMTNDFSILINSVLIGLGFLGFGMLLYGFKQWGDGDAWLLGAMGFLFPDQAGFAPLVEGGMPFPMTLFFNFFLISLFYLIVYAVVLGLRTPAVLKTFLHNIRNRRKEIAGFTMLLVLASVFATAYLSYSLSIPFYTFSNILLLPFLALLILLFLQYARAVEGDLFKRKIPVSKLKAGDVLVSDRWRGLTEKEVGQMKKKGGKVWIKEGVRFAPVFVITLIVTLFLGSVWGLLFPVL